MTRAFLARHLRRLNRAPAGANLTIRCPEKERWTVSSAPESHQTHRRSWRVDALGAVAILVNSRPLLAVLRDISATGFAVETSQSFKEGVSQRFELRLPGSAIEVDATCVHVMPSSNWNSGEPIFLVGFAFDGLNDHARSAVRNFVDQTGAPSAVVPARPLPSWSRL
jgi:hypothetical protein